MRTALDSGAVILGRAGAAAFRHEPNVLRVRLFGPAEARIAQAGRIENVDERTARRLLPEVDRPVPITYKGSMPSTSTTRTYITSSWTARGCRWICARI